MSESREYRVRVTELESGLLIIRDLSEPVKAFQQKVSVPACHVPLSCDYSSPIPAIIRLLIKKEKQARRAKNALQKKAERWEAVARYLAGRCHEIDTALNAGVHNDPDLVLSPEEWLELAQSKTEPKKEPTMKNDPALKLCPFCGGRAAIGKVTYTIDNKEYFFANCIECQARCTDATGSMYDTPEEAAKAWNRRTESVRDVLDDFKKYHEGYKQAVIDMTTVAAFGVSHKKDAQVEEEDDGGPAPRPVKGASK